MLLSSPGDNGSSLSIDSLQKQPDAAEGQRSIESDRDPSDHTHEFSSNGRRVNSDASESRSATQSHGGTFFESFSHRQSSRSQSAQAHETELDGLYALRQAAGLNALRRARVSLLSKGTLARLAANTAIDYAAEANSFAAPLSPLRARDTQALSELFLRDDIYAIEADVSQRLLALLPEPCWEDDVFAFLKEFL
ncbi:hypothetical protein [Stenomitos frigidus]|uniref:hypothetical protein n=1 Tax=Stenomitos frigidus TaxID=1886765 RepID=UPI001C637856|nr:hypothetical protein [Stenomitos frigidus]